MNQLQTELSALRSLEQESLDIRKYFGVVWREKWGISGFVGITTLLMFVFLENMTPIYSATATLLIESKSTNVVSVEEIYGIDSSRREYFATQFEILDSRRLAESVIETHNLDSHPGFDPRQVQPRFELSSILPFLDKKKELTEDEAWAVVVGRFRKNLDIQPIRNTQLVKISYESADPVLARDLVNTLGDVYINSHLESKLAMTQKAADWLTDRLGVMQDDLQHSERELQAYRDKEDLVELSGVATLVAKEIDEVTQRLVAARNKVTELRSQFEAVGSSSYDPRWETLPGVLEDPLAQRLKEQEEDAVKALSQISRRYGPKHPKHIAAHTKSAESGEVYRRQVTKVVSGFERAYEQAISDVKELESALEQNRGEIREINRKNYELTQLEREAETNRQLYEMFFTRFKETDTADFQAANARFVDYAVTPITPVKPNKLLLLFIAVIISGLVGVVLAFVKDFLDATVRSAKDVEQKLGQPIIGVLPIVRDSDKVGLWEAFFEEKARAFAEAVRTARTNVTLSGIDKPLKKLVVTSSVPGEGKTTTSMNLAFAFGQVEKVVLLDADMRRPSVAKNCELENHSPGLSNIMAGTETLESCIYQYKGIDVIPAGVIPPNPLELLSSERFNQLLSVLEDRYERVIIDSAPTQAVSDSLVLSSHVDGVIYVVKSDSTATMVSVDGISRLSRVGARILGVVLNQFDAKTAAKYGGYSKGYYDYYGYGANKVY